MKKTKGDIGELKTATVLVEEGWYVFLPIGIQPKYDFLIERDGKVARVQAKYRAADDDNVVRISLKSTWSNQKGIHRSLRQPGDFDILAVYCPTNKECYFFADQEIESKTQFNLRIKITGREVKEYNWERTAWTEEHRDPHNAWKIWKEDE